MTAPRFSPFLGSKLTLFGLAFFAVNAGASYAFYQVNSYKLLVALLGALLLVAWFEGFGRKTWLPFAPRGLYFSLLLPTVAALPAAVVGGFAENYNFAYELASNLIIWLWAVYLYQTLAQPGQDETWVGWLAVTLAWSGLWALGEGTGWLGDGPSLAGQVKASFGHRNYFASYLIQMLPLFFALALPIPGQAKELKRNLWAALAILALAALVLTQTRAAIAAAMLSMMLVGAGYAWFLIERRQGKRLLAALASLSLAGLLGLGLYGLGVSADPLQGNRIEQIFSRRAWIGRLIPWETAWKAFVDAPFFGHGLGSSYNLFFTYVAPDTRLYHHERSYNHAHSEWLEYLAEAGLLGWVAYGLAFYWIYRALKKVLTAGSPVQRRLGLGFGGALIAFQVHGAFSVAPRMIVAELPWALSLAALFGLAAQIAGPSPLATRHRRSLAMLNLSLLTLAAALLFPWLAQQNAYRRIMNLPATTETAQTFEELAQNSNDIYMLDQLLGLQIQLNRPEQMRRTLEQIDGLIPHYRETDYRKAVWAVLLRKREEARKLAQEAQTRDRYYLPNLRLLTSMALEADDFDGFAYQMDLLLRRHLVRNFVIIAFGDEQVPIEHKATSWGMEFRSEPNKLRVRLDPFWLRRIFDQAQDFRRSPPGPLEREQVLNQLTRQIAQNPYFRLQVKPEFLAEEAQVFDLLRQFHEASREWASRKDFLQFSRNQDLSRAHNEEDRQRIAADHQDRLAQAQTAAVERLAKLEAQLKAKSDFPHFLTKHRFAAQWIQEIQQIYFP
ncbi:MAG: O-antigen ligase family protein [bacterium]|nr:O-antigen ligase family protein [bacterium]